MEVYNQEKTSILESYDLTKGYLINDKLERVIPAVNAVEEKGHYKTIKEYPNGGKDVEWVVDIPGVKGVEEHVEYEDIKVFIPYEPKELKVIAAQNELLELKNWFNEVYTYQEQKYRRLMSLNKLDDDGIGANVKLRQLYGEAEIKRAKIQELENIIKETNA